MTTIATAHQYAGKDAETDRHIDVHVDARTAARKDGRNDAVDGRRGYVIVLANHKGGVTKTTSTANLGAMFAEAGQRVLIVDCDPQANLSEAFGWGEDSPASGSRTCSPTRRPPAATRRPSRCSPMSRRSCVGASGCGSSPRPTRWPTSPPTYRRSPAPATSTGCGRCSTRSVASSISCCWTPRPGWERCRGWPCWPLTGF